MARPVTLFTGQWADLPFEEACKLISSMGYDGVELAKEFKHKIHHIHWKDLGEEWIPKRGTMFGCGFSTIAVGDGVVDIKGVIDVLKDQDIPYSTLEIVGNEDILRRSKAYIEKYWN